MPILIKQNPLKRLGLLTIAILLVLIIVLGIPVLIFEYSTNNNIDFSLQAISNGSLVNVTEKELINSNFDLLSGTSHSLKMQKKDSLRINNMSIPVTIDIQFNPVRPDFAIYREPIAIYIWFSAKYDSILLNYFAGVLRKGQTNTQTGSRNSGAEDTVPIFSDHDIKTEWPYYLNTNLYYFILRSEPVPGISVLHTTIFSGKLFLMLKFFVYQFYSAIPESIGADWFATLQDFQ